MGLLVSLPTGPKRAAVIHLALSTRWRTSIKDEKETSLAGRQKMLPRKDRLFFSNKHTNQRCKFRTILQIFIRIEIKSQTCTVIMPNHHASLLHVHKLPLIISVTNNAARSLQRVRTTVINDQQRSSLKNKFHRALFSHPALIISSDMVGKTIH